MTICLSLRSPSVSLFSVCNEYMAVEDMSSSTDARVGSRSFNLQENEVSDVTVILEVNITLHGNWTLHGYMYSMGMLGNTPTHTTVDKQVAATSLLLSDVVWMVRHRAHCIWY